MARGGYRPGAGRPRGSRNKIRKIGGVPSDVVEEARQACLSPLAHMLRVMNDQGEDPNRRDRMAIAALRFCHPIKTRRTTNDSE